MIAAVCLGLLVGQSTGCSIFNGLNTVLKRHEGCDEFMIGHRNQAMALKAWYREKPQFGHHQYLKDLKQGFLDGYLEVAEGGNGCVPKVAPPDYWGWRYQSPDGQRAMNAWFEGFPLGAKAAEQDGIGNWSHIRMMSPAVAHPAVEHAGGSQLSPMFHHQEGERIIPGSVIEVDQPLHPSEAAGPQDALEEIAPPIPETTDDLGANLIVPRGVAAFPRPASDPFERLVGEMIESSPRDSAMTPSDAGGISFRFE